MFTETEKTAIAAAVESSGTKPAATATPAAAPTPAPTPAPAAAAAPAAAVAATPAQQSLPLPPVNGKKGKKGKQETTVAKAETIDDSKPDNLLLRILQTRRAHGSTGDLNFRTWLFEHIKRMGYKPEIIGSGNIFVSTDPKSDFLFSCHVDTVHSTPESNVNAPQQLAFDPAFGHIFLAEKDSCGCLGADDGVGVYILLKMLEAKKPGKYMFHVGEERGGIGANEIQSKAKELVEDLNAVIAFDRAVRDNDNPEIIHTQGGRRCASDAFSRALAAKLSAPEFGFEKPWVISDKGSFTDSKVYAGSVPECVNVGCFYNRQHTSNEYVDWFGLKRLVEAVIAIDWYTLPIARDPKVEPAGGYAGRSAFGGGGGGGEYGTYKGSTYGGYEGYSGAAKSHNGHTKPPASAPSVAKFPTAPSKLMAEPTIMDELKDMSYDEIQSLIYDDSDRAAMILVGLLTRVEGLEAELAGYKRIFNLV